MAILQYKENSKQKAAELLISLESEFRTSILPILVKLEYNELYTNEYDCHLQDVINNPPQKNISNHLEKTTDLEKVFRFFHVCSGVRRLDVDLSTLNIMCGYWLCVLNSTEAFLLAKKRPGAQAVTQQQRTHLTEYMSIYWPSVKGWADEFCKAEAE